MSPRDFKCRVCGKDIKIQIRRNTGICSEKCEKITRLNPDFGR